MNNLPNDWPLVDPFDYGIRPGEHLMFASSVARKSVKHTARIALSSLKSPVPVRYPYRSGRVEQAGLMFDRQKG